MGHGHIAIGGSVVGASAAVIVGYFALRSARLTVRQSEREAWTTRLLAAAKEFGDHSAAAQESVTKVLNKSPLTQDDIESMNDRALETVRSFTTIQLIFGPGSRATESARAVFAYLSESVAASNRAALLTAKGQSEKRWLRDRQRRGEP